MTSGQRLDSAAARIGRVSAGLDLAPQPEECGIDEPHAEFRRGEDKTLLLDRERDALDRANASKRRCYDFNEAVRARPRGNEP